MKIGIDARLINETGVGRYIRNLLRELAILDKKNQYVIFLRKRTFENFQIPNCNWQKRLAEVPWHSLCEQLTLPFIFSREHLDLLHVPYFNVPLFYPGRYVVTIHDLTILQVNTGKASTLWPPLYWCRRLGYQLILRLGAWRASQIIAVSQTVKQAINQNLRVNPQKIKVTYEGVDPNFTRFRKSDKNLVGRPYFLYIGNVYPHKNVELLLKAFAIYRKNHPKTKLVLVGKLDFFYRRLQESNSVKALSDALVFWGEASDNQLINLYRRALALVFPSRQEGFGLPVLEALALGCPVICAKIPVFVELFADTVTLIDPNDMFAWVRAMGSVLKPSKFDLTKFSWQRLAGDTLRAYEVSRCL